MKQYVNFMIALSPGGSGQVIITGHDSLVTRSNHTCSRSTTAQIKVLKFAKRALYKSMARAKELLFLGFSEANAP